MPSIYRYRDARRASEAIEETAGALIAGALALIPTETVYGIAVAVSALTSADGELPGPDAGYRRIFSLKRRDPSQTVPLLVAGTGDLDRYGRDITSEIRLVASAFWPGALTIVVPARDTVPRFMRAADGTVALRASASPAVAGLVRACGCALAATSANTHAMPAPTSFDEVEPRILAGVDVAIDAGATPCRDASTVISLRGGALEVLRAGALPPRDIEGALRHRERSGHDAGRC